MAQYDVFVNPQPASRDAVPYVVDIQCGLIEQLPSRLVMPLSRVGADRPRLPLNLCPRVEIKGEALLLMPHLSAPVAARLLKKPVETLKHRASDIHGALDAVLSGF